MALAAPPTVAALGGADPKAQKLGLSVETQLQTNWCWAAVSTSVSLFYDAGSTWSQCTVADAALPRTDCCGAGASAPDKCNKPWYLDTALKVTDNFASMISATLSFAQIQAEIGRDTPLCTRVRWSGGTAAHFQAIVGWLVGDTGVEYLDVSDPIYLDSQIAFSDFASSYQSGGDWTHTYFTQPSAGGGAVAMAAVVVAISPEFPEAIGA
jgi:hypothetical protein